MQCVCCQQQLYCVSMLTVCVLLLVIVHTVNTDSVLLGITKQANTVCNVYATNSSSCWAVLGSICYVLCVFNVLRIVQCTGQYYCVLLLLLAVVVGQQGERQVRLPIDSPIVSLRIVMIIILMLTLMLQTLVKMKRWNNGFQCLHSGVISLLIVITITNQCNVGHNDRRDTDSDDNYDEVQDNQDDDDDDDEHEAQSVPRDRRTMML